MSNKDKTYQDHIDSNYKFFKKQLDEGKLDNKIGKYALIVNEEIKHFFDTWNDAESAGVLLSGQDNTIIFSIQEVTKIPSDLGCYSRAFI